MGHRYRGPFPKFATETPMTHHVMNQTGHQFPNVVGVKPEGLVICPRQQILLVSGGKQKQIESDIERRFILIELRFKMFSEAYSAALHTDLRC